MKVARRVDPRRHRMRRLIAALRPGKARVVRLAGGPVAIYRGNDGTLSGLSGVCTHDGTCLVEFNHDETCWQCPRHGARFGLDGVVERGPATENLQPVDLSRFQG